MSTDRRVPIDPVPIDPVPADPVPIDELVALYDPDDVVGRVVGSARRSRMRSENLWHAAASVLLRRSDGRILVHRRAEHKDLWPGRHDLACGGVITAGESPEACARRELAEEVGVELGADGAELRPVLTTWYRDHETRASVFLFDVVWDGEVRFADGEVAEAWWMQRDELEALLSGPEHLFVPDGRALWRILAAPVQDAGPWPAGAAVIIRRGHRGRTLAARVGTVVDDRGHELIVGVQAGAPAVDPTPEGGRAMTRIAHDHLLWITGPWRRRRTVLGSRLVDLPQQTVAAQEPPLGAPPAVGPAPAFPPDWDVPHVDPAPAFPPDWDVPHVDPA